jgi:hypothetical protein
VYKVSNRYDMKKTVHEIIEEINEKYRAENMELKKEMTESKAMI